MEAQKKIAVYHYSKVVGEVIAELLKQDYSAEYIPISRKTLPGHIAEDINLRSPDLVFISLNFGDSTSHPIDSTSFNEGLEALVKIKNMKSLPVVIVTGYGDNYREEALAKGADGYLMLPAKREQILELANILAK